MLPNSLFVKPVNKKIFFGFIAIFLFALILRLYKLTAPLWFDEIYGFSLAQRGFFVILRNSFRDPHPPLYYFYIWISTGFGTFHNEISLRWLSVFFGALTIPVIWQSSRLLAGILPATLISLVAATSPAMVFYSQEARPFAILIFIASLTVYLVIKASIAGSNLPRIYIYWTMLTLVGIYCGYSYLMVAGLQLIYLGFIDRWRRRWWLSAVIVILSTIAIIPFAISSLRSAAIIHLDSTPLTFWRTLQTIMAGESGRFGVTIAHSMAPILILFLCLMSLFGGINNRLSLYLLLQSIYPFAVIFLLLTPIFKIRLPLPEAKQFLELLPLIFILASVGLAWFTKKFVSQRFLKISLLCIFTVGLLWMNSLGLRNYWKIPKSPESTLVNMITEKMQPEDEVVSLYFSLNSSLGFYSRFDNIYVSPKQNENDFEFDMIPKNSRFFYQFSVPNEKISTSQLRKRGHFWVVFRTNFFKDALDSLTRNCEIADKFKIHQFEAIKVVSCPLEQ